MYDLFLKLLCSIRGTNAKASSHALQWRDFLAFNRENRILFLFTSLHRYLFQDVLFAIYLAKFGN